MQRTDNQSLRTRGRFSQMRMYLAKFFRLFIYQDDWKVLPMAVLISGLVAITIGKKMFTSQEGTIKGALALSCVAIWNGFFNSVQTVCRERNVVKREHSSGMYLSSYIVAHAVYQACICLVQSVINVIVCKSVGVPFPEAGIVTPWFLLDFTITTFLLTFAADMIALLISCLARSTTGAMTVIPFILIFELLFSNSMFGVDNVRILGNVTVSHVTVARWGMNAMCAQADYNNLPTYTAWNMIQQFCEYDTENKDSYDSILAQLGDEEHKEEFCRKAAKPNQKPEYECSKTNIVDNWFMLISFALVHIVLAIILLKRVEKDKR